MKKSAAFLVLITLSACSYLPNQEIFFNSLDEVDGIFITGMEGCENIVLAPDSMKVYVTGLAGDIYLLDGESYSNLQIVKTLHLNDMALGIGIGPDGNIYAVGTDEGWEETGGMIYRIDPDLQNYLAITGLYPGINGLGFDGAGHLYFTTGNLKMINPKGAIYRIDNPGEEWIQPELFIADLGSANGIDYDPANGRMVYTETYRGVSAFDPKTGESEFIAGKMKMVEGFDDVCVDSAGRFWVADPPGGFIKMYDPLGETATTFRIDGIGIASSIRTRVENGREMLYITERLQSSASTEQNGRGVIIIPVDALVE